MRTGLLRYIFLVLPLLMVSSCSTTSDGIDKLNITTRAYERAIRWGDFVRAKAFHKKSPVLRDIERRRLKFYRISGYTIINNDTPDLNNAYMMVDIKFYKNDRPVIKSISVKQHWVWDKKSESWYLDSPFPKFR